MQGLNLRHLPCEGVTTGRDRLSSLPLFCFFKRLLWQAGSPAYCIIRRIPCSTAQRTAQYRQGGPRHLTAYPSMLEIHQGGFAQYPHALLSLINPLRGRYAAPARKQSETERIGKVLVFITPQGCRAAAGRRTSALLCCPATDGLAVRSASCPWAQSAFECSRSFCSLAPCEARAGAGVRNP